MTKSHKRGSVKGVERESAEDGHGGEEPRGAWGSVDGADVALHTNDDADDGIVNATTAAAGGTIATPRHAEEKTGDDDDNNNNSNEDNDGNDDNDDNDEAIRGGAPVQVESRWKPEA
jgi:hypothetical protein